MILVYAKIVMDRANGVQLEGRRVPIVVVRENVPIVVVHLLDLERLHSDHQEEASANSPPLLDLNHEVDSALNHKLDLEPNHKLDLDLNHEADLGLNRRSREKTRSRKQNSSSEKGSTSSNLPIPWTDCAGSR